MHQTHQQAESLAASFDHAMCQPFHGRTPGRTKLFSPSLDPLRAEWVRDQRHPLVAVSLAQLKSNQESRTVLSHLHWV